MKRIVFALFLLWIITGLKAQETSLHSISGTVVDKITSYPLAGANVVLLNSDPMLGTATDQNGNFVLKGVTLGRHDLEISYIGYTPRMISNLFVSAGKTTQIQVQLEENLNEMDEVAVRYEKPKDRAQNDMALVSSRTFSVEETERFAGSLGDPARMVANYAGVVTHNDSRNDIIIRGNSPIGVLWRMEGIEIPNPNHFSALGTTGGPVSMVNNNQLRNSDFLTGAFPAEFGNATAGVFDLNLRSGNSDSHDFLGQIGFNGFELGAEGPMFKTSPTQKASYLVNYRYSTFGLISKLPIDFGTGAAVPDYQDLNFIIDLPGTKAGRFKLIGLWGKSFISMGRELADTTETSYNARGTATDFGSNLGVLGLTHTLYINPNSRFYTTISAQTTSSTTLIDSTKNNLETIIPMYRNLGQETRYSFSTQFRQKINSNNHYNIGLVVDLFQVHFMDSIRDYELQEFITTADYEGKMSLWRAYAQWHHSFGAGLNGYLGMHSQYFAQSDEWTIEPRAGMEWKPGSRGTFSLGYGLHSQIQPKSVYVYQSRDEQTGAYYLSNERVKATRSHHLVLGYNHMFSKQLRLKAETYYQHLFRIPVSHTFPEFSMVNAGDYFAIPNVDSLQNTGTGYNCGVELTLEKFLGKGYYLLFTTSLFDSKYRGYDGILRNTAFNGNYVMNLLGGYERKLGKNTFLTCDLKLVWAGGRRYVPIDLESSLAEGSDQRDWSRAYEEKYPDYFRTDLRLGVKLNSKKFSQEFAIDLQNLTGYQSIFTEIFDADKGEIYKVYQQGFYPMVLYRIQF